MRLVELVAQQLPRSGQDTLDLHRAQRIVDIFKRFTEDHLGHENSREFTGALRHLLIEIEHSTLAHAAK